MLRQACSRVKVVPFKRPGVAIIANDERHTSSVKLMGLLERPVTTGSPYTRSALLVPMLPSPDLPSLPSSTPCSLVFIDFCRNRAKIVAFTHLSPGLHVFVAGHLRQFSGRNGLDTFRVSVTELRPVQDSRPPPPGPGIDPSTLQALVTDQCSRWSAYFHSPSEWLGYGTCTSPLFVHKYTGVRLWARSPTTPNWVRERLGLN